MASESDVKQYLAYWLQLGKKVQLNNGARTKKIQRVLQGEHYSQELEELWQELRSPDSKDCYLEGTSETINQLLSSEWEITNCPRCPMIKPQRIAGRPVISCPCEELSNWPNLELPPPRKPVRDRQHLTAITNRLDQMGLKADLYALSMAASPTEIQPEEIRDRFREQSELILNSASEGICGLNEQGEITFANPAAYELLGYDSLELIGKDINKILSLPEFTKTEFLNQLAFIQDTENGIFWRINGTSFPGEYAIAPVKHQKKIIGAVLTFKDITERLEIERMKDEFISMVSHELRTPLTAIRGSLEMITSGLLDKYPHKAKRMLEIAVKNTDRLLRLVNDILDLDRISSGKVAIVQQTCDVGDLMMEAVDSIQAIADKKSITIKFIPMTASVWADPDQVVQLVTNLLSNAIKFSDVGSTVYLTVSVQKPEIIFQVKDQGRGIPADKLQTIFGRFEQVDSSDSRLFGGTGLGLAICQAIVDRHQGRIWVESEEGKGSTFVFSLPMFPSQKS
jgi:PAS domain S-box-containing protein